MIDAEQTRANKANKLCVGHYFMAKDKQMIVCSFAFAYISKANNEQTILCLVMMNNPKLEQWRRTNNE